MQTFPQSCVSINQLISRWTGSREEEAGQEMYGMIQAGDRETKWLRALVQLSLTFSHIFVILINQDSGTYEWLNGLVFSSAC